MVASDGFLVDFPTLGDVGDAWVKQHCKVPDGFQRGADFAWADWQYWCAANFYRIRPGAQWENPVSPLFNQAFTYRRAQIVAPQKALALDTPIATPDGWSTMADIGVGDFVFDENGDPTEVVSKSPVWESDTYRVTFSDGASLVACKDHQWWVEWRKGPTWCGPVRVRTEDLLRGGEFRVPNAQPLQLPDRELPVDPYEVGVQLGSSSSSRQIPAEYLRASEPQRLALLMGLMDSASYEQRIGIGGMDELWHSLGRSHSGAKATYAHRRIVSVERIETVPTQCLTVAAKSHVFLAGEKMIPTCNTGKGPWSASVACLEAVGPSQFLGWAGKDDGYVCADHGCRCGWEYPYLEGEPMGMRHPSPVIQLTATSEDQVANVYRPLTAMIKLSGPLSDLLKVREGFIRIAGENPGDDFDRIDAVSSSANGRIGNPVSWVLHDETGLYTKRNKMLGIADAQRRGAAGMNGRTMETTNAWDPSENSYAQRTYESRVDDIFKFYKIPPKQLSWGNKRERRQILRYVYEGSPWVNLDSIEAEASELNETDPAQAERFFGNRLVYGQGSWLRDGLWESRYQRQPVMA